MTRNRRRIPAALLVVVVCVLFLSSRAFPHSRHRFCAGGPDGVGGIPYTSGPLPPDVTVPFVQTIGLVVDSEATAMPGVAVVVLSAEGSVVATGLTDECGLFVLDLPLIAGLTVSLPLNGVSELPIEAGVPVLIVVP